MNRYFKLFSNCIPVKGAKRSVICDLQKGSILLIPNDLYEILSDFKNSSVQEIINYFGKKNEEIILSYFKILEDNEFIFYTEDKKLLKRFPEIHLDWDYPATITNALIDFDAKNITGNYFDQIIYQLDELNCQFLQLRYYCKFNISDFFNKVAVINNSSKNYIELVIPYDLQVAKEDQIEQLLNEQKVSKIIYYNSPTAEFKQHNRNTAQVLFTKKDILSEKHCGIITPDHFMANLQLFSEGQKNNTCLNRKIGIDVNGEIKNCPSMSLSFGNISETNIKEVVLNKNFSELWSINKNEIHICKDCEFRFVCTDCRAYLEEPEDTKSKPLKCGYDPYTCTWQDWSNNPLKRDIISHYEIPL